MRKEEFKQLLLSATEQARQFALEYVNNDLPLENVYNILLSLSHDDPVLTQFDLYPEDNGKVIGLADTDMVIATLLRKGKVPVWIDISVAMVQKGKTVLALSCAGRYSDDLKELYYHERGMGPFGVKSPILPIDYEKGKKFWLPNPGNNYQVAGNRYRFDTARCINLWLVPGLLCVLMFGFLFSRIDSWGDVSARDMLGWVLFFTFSTGIFIFLFFNHLPLARQTELIISDETFKIVQGEQSYSCDLSDIKEVFEYSTGRLPWSSIAKWIIKTGDREFKVSSLTISKLNLERHFWNKTKDKTSLFPML